MREFKPGDKVVFIKLPTFYHKSFKVNETVVTIKSLRKAFGDKWVSIKECDNWFYEKDHLKLAMPDIYADDE